MVLEKIIPVDKAEHNFLYGILFGAIISLIAIIVGANVFKSDPSMAALLFIVIGAVPFFRKMLFLEELEVERESVWQLFRSSRKIITVFFSFYLGVALTYLTFSLLPSIPFIGHPAALFENQIRVFSGVTGNFLNPQAFFAILSNNLQVILLALVLSLLYGSGAVLILAWNASTLGVFLASLGITGLVYLPHAIFEFVGFFSAAVAGGLLSVILEEHKLGTKKSDRVTKDIMILTLISIALIIIGALVESSLF